MCWSSDWELKPSLYLNGKSLLNQMFLYLTKIFFTNSLAPSFSTSSFWTRLWALLPRPLLARNPRTRTPSRGRGETRKDRVPGGGDTRVCGSRGGSRVGTPRDGKGLVRPDEVGNRKRTREGWEVYRVQQRFYKTSWQSVNTKNVSFKIR